MTSRIKRNGFSLLGVVVALALTGVSFYFFQKGLQSTVRTVAAQRQKTIAALLATELLELFQSAKPAKLRSYLSTNPADNTKPSYSLCAHINILDRAGGKIINEDPVAQLAPSPLDNQEAGANLQANRFYMVQVINIETMAFNTGLCGTSFSALPALGPNERFHITVGVTWVPKLQIQSEAIERVVVSTVLAS